MDYKRLVAKNSDVPSTEHYALIVWENLSYDDGYDPRDGGGTSTLRYMNYYVYQPSELEICKQDYQKEMDQKYSNPECMILHVKAKAQIKAEIKFSF